MAAEVIPSWQHPVPSEMTGAPLPATERMAWPYACLLIGFVSAVLWSAIWTAVVALFG